MPPECQSLQMEHHKLQLSEMAVAAPDEPAAEPPNTEAADTGTPAPDCTTASGAGVGNGEAEPMEEDGRQETPAKQKKTRLIPEAITAIDVHEKTGMMAYSHAGALDNALRIVPLPGPVAV